MARFQTLPRSAEAYYAAQRREFDAALRAVQRQWGRISPGRVAASWDELAPSLLAVLLTAQGRVSRPAAGYVEDVLAETGGRVARDFGVTPGPLVGYAGDGRPVEGLLAQAPLRTLDAIGDGMPPVAAAAVGGRFLNLAASSVLSDTARGAETLEMAARPKMKYVRMLNPPSCSRCAILAGRIYNSAEGFGRHPGCDCRTIPSAESVAGDFTVDPQAYFDSLPEVEQSRVFTGAGAEAIRAGADPAKVVNARRGMTTAAQNQRGWVAKGRLQPTRVNGRSLYLTREGPTRGKAPRLMPESIIEIAENPADLKRLLRLNGYLT